MQSWNWRLRVGALIHQYQVYTKNTSTQIIVGHIHINEEILSHKLSKYNQVVKEKKNSNKGTVV